MSIYKLKNHESGPIPKDELPALQTAIRAMRAARKKLTSKQFDIVSDFSDGTIDVIDEKDFKDIPKEDIKKYAEAINLIQESKRQYGEEAVIEAVRKTPDLDENQQPAPLTPQEEWQKPKPHNNKYRLKNDPDSSHDSSNDTPNDNPNNPNNPDGPKKPLPEGPKAQPGNGSQQGPQPSQPNTRPTQPKGDMPLPQNKDDSKTDNPLPTYDALTVGVVNQDKDLKAKAIYSGESRLADEINEGGFIKRALKKIWKGGIAKSFYRQKYINEAKRDMVTAQNIVLDYNEDERRRYNRGICKAFISEQEGIIDEKSGDKRKSLAKEHPEIHAKIQDIVARYASGDIKTPEEASRQFKEIVRDLENGTYSGENGHIAISNISEIAVEAKRRYEALMTVSETMNGKLEHDEAIARVMAGFDVKYGERRMDRLDPRYNKVDKLVSKIQESKIGALVSPETIALATGATMAVFDNLGRRVPSLVFAGIPGLNAAITSGLRASADFEKDRARALYDERYSRKFDGNQKRRKEMVETLHEHHSANEVREDLKKRIDAINEAKAKGVDTTAMQKELLQAVAKCKTYLNFEKTNKSVLTYSNEVEAPEEQLLLLEQLGNAKQALRDGGVDVDKELDAKSSLMTSSIEAVNNNLKETEKTKRKAKVKTVAKRAGISLAAGAVAGVAMQEIRAVFDPNVQGMFEKGAGNYGSRLTAGKKLALMITGKDKLSPDMKGHLDINGNSVIDNSKQLDFAQAKDGTFNLVDKDGKVIAKGLDWNSKTGEMTPSSIKALEAQGIKVSVADKLRENIKTSVETTKSREVSLSEYMKNTTDHLPKVRRSYWYDNNTTAFDQNELRCYYYQDGSGNNGLVTGMLDNGSFHGDKVAEFSKLASNGSIKLMISPTSETQGTPIEVVGKLLPDGQMSFCPEPDTAAARFFDSDGKFIGKFAEVVQDLGTNADGETMIAPLATVVGEGKDITLPIWEKVTDIVDTPVDVPDYLFQFPGHEWDFPIILPFSPAGAMNASKHNEVHKREGKMNANLYGYNMYDLDPRNVDRHNELGETSPRIAEGKTLELGTEVSWYVDDQIKNKGGQEYYDRLKDNYNKSPELKSIDNNIKTIVTIPVHAPSEADNIYRTLSLYANQEGVDMGSFMVLLDMNWRGDNEKGSPAEVAAKIQATRDRIEEARRDFPNLKVAVVNQPQHEGIHDVARFMNDAAMMAINESIKGGRMSADHEVIVIRNDADTKHMNKNYIASYQKAAEENPKTPLFNGQSWFDIKRQKEAPGFAGTQVVERICSIYGALDGEVYTEGRNFAYRAKHFAAMNGYGFAADNAEGWIGAGSDDVRLGFRMDSAFRQAYADRVDKSTDQNSSELMDATTRMLVRVGGATIDTDDNRQLEFYEAGRAGRANYTTNDVYGATPGGYNTNVIRPDAIKDFIEDMTDRQSFNATASQFEREIERFYSWSMEPHNPRMQNIMSWFFGVDASELDSLYTLEPYPDGQRRLKMTFTDKGRERLREALVARFGDGFSTDDRNTLQKAITENKWMAPADNPAPAP